ncbi:hypothetical protein [Phaeodactylibacter xiamenensis]|uniref:hypothetical protein n=1 Tax=Phaeodactylibacter xiamenensis TaxID=1524460 RepID=UPI003BA9CCBA
MIDIHYSILIFFIGTLGGVGWFQDFMFFWFYIFVVLYAWVLPVSLSAEADAKALGDWPAFHNLSVWTGQYWRFRLRRSVGAAWAVAFERCRSVWLGGKYYIFFSWMKRNKNHGCASFLTGKSQTADSRLQTRLGAWWENGGAGNSLMSGFQVVWAYWLKQCIRATAWPSSACDFP